jgi:hypothetical protein
MMVSAGRLTPVQPLRIEFDWMTASDIRPDELVNQAAAPLMSAFWFE